MITVKNKFSYYNLRENDKHFVIDEDDIINKLLEKFGSKQRIKLLSYDVSEKYFVFGANTGGIYIFNRGRNAGFFKLIPSKNQGSISLVSISPNEQNILVADENGVIIVLENCFARKNFHSHVFQETRDKSITASKWDGDTKVYIGDNAGMVSIITLPTIVNLLYTAFVSLMELSAPILQLDAFGRFLLATTEQKTFICDTEREIYKQVGRKTKGKAFGACFYNTFENVPEHLDNFENCKLFCTRPGLRLWESNFEGEVLYTHKYSDAAPQIPTILHLKKNLVITACDNCEDEIFGQIYMFKNKYLCIVGPKKVYVVDPVKNELLFQHTLPEGSDVRIIGPKIYMWENTKGKLRIFTFHTFDELLVNIINTKNFKVGIELVVKYQEDIMNWSKSSPNVKLINELNGGLQYVDDNTKNQFETILAEMQIYEDNLLIQYKDQDDPKILNINDNERNNEIDEKLQIILKQYKSNKEHLTVQYSDMLTTMNANELAQFFKNSIDQLEDNSQTFKNWCYNQVLYHFQYKVNASTPQKLKQETVDFITHSYLEVNQNLGPSCVCSFPLPGHAKTPTYNNLSQLLMDYHDDQQFLVSKIPYLWSCRLNNLKIEDIESNLPIIVQFGDFKYLNRFHRLITYDTCDKILTLHAKLKAGYCLNCSRTFSNKYQNNAASWEKVALILLPLIGAKNVLRLLIRYHRNIPQGELSEHFYMTCMVSSTKQQEPILFPDEEKM